MFNLWNQDGGTDCYKLGYYLPEPNERMEFTASGSESLAWDRSGIRLTATGPTTRPVSRPRARWSTTGTTAATWAPVYIFQNGVCVTGGAH